MNLFFICVIAGRNFDKATLIIDNYCRHIFFYCSFREQYVFGSALRKFGINVPISLINAALILY